MPYKDKEQQREYDRRYYREHAEECNAYRKQYYREHIEKEREYGRQYKRERYYAFRQKGLCVKCGKPAVLGETFCASCNYKNRLSCLAYYSRNRKQEAERRRIQSARYLTEGKCYHCGAPLMEGENKYCINCSMHTYRQYLGWGRRRHEVNYKAIARQS